VRSSKLVILTAAASMLAAIPMWAHHSFAAEYDRNKPIKFKDVVVTKYEWTNPHARFYVDVKDDPSCTANCKVTNWNFELASPNVLKRSGWTRNSMKEGDRVSVVGSAAKDGAKMGNAQTVMLADGTMKGAGSSIDDDKK
jgi:hypothetical protein